MDIYTPAHQAKLLIEDPLRAFDRVNRERPKRIPEDICETKHGGNTASVAAHEKTRHTKLMMYEELTELFRAHGDLTSKQVVELYYGNRNHNRNATSPRLSEMKAMGWLEETGQILDGCHVLRLVRNDGDQV
jgi:hypothetical protein